jgi:hypothetical protein
MPKAASHDDTKLIKTNKRPRDGSLNLYDYLTTEPRERHTKAQQLEEARRRFLRDNR